MLSTRFQRSKICIVASLCLLTSLAFLAPAAQAGQFVSVKKDGVNVRSGPNTSDEVLWEVFRGFPLEVLDKKGDWTHVVDFEGDKGWIYTPLLSDEHTVIVKVNTANMRIGPGQNYEIVATVKYGVVFKPIGSDGDWIKVKHADGTTGWIFKDLLWPLSP